MLYLKKGQILIILGICDSIESHACLVKNGKLIAAISEERMSRIKADAGYPKKSIDRVLEISGIKPNQIDIIAIAGFDNGLFASIYKPGALFSIHDWIEQNEKYWKPKLYENKKLYEIDDFNIWKKKYPKILKNPYRDLVKRTSKKNVKDHLKIFNEVRIKVICNHLGVSKNRIKVFRHETCHQYYGLFSQQQYKNKTLVLTLEGGGDDSSATVSIANNGTVEEIYRTNDAMIGRLYRYVTLLLGMKPSQHEYKVMGLAPYGQEYHGKKSLLHFEKFNKIIGYKIINKRIFKDVYLSSRKALNGERFDGIAWGLQTCTENFLKKWVLNCISKFKIKDIIISGGVAQNIKAVKVLLDEKKINSIWAGPISGDGSLSIGAAWLATKLYDKKNKIKSLDNIYLGSEIYNKEIKTVLKKKCQNFKVLKNVKNKQVAKWIADGLIIARCKGKMEFGQRALGNRSILADPRRHETVEKINSKIKYRDFWMPFTPTILHEHVNKVILNPKGVYSPFMTVAFDTKEEFIKKIPGVIHPADKTTRPQMLKKKINPDYYDLINEFYKLTKIPLLLNTSFNLHGDAIVENAEQAINTFKKSDLDVLLLNDFAIIRRSKN